jgi:GNAT superfamily N-acetyltransferase
MVPVVRIRDAHASEVGALEDLQRRASTVWEDYREQLEAHPDAIEVSPQAVGAGHVRIAIGPSDERLGFSVVLRSGEHTCELDGLFVEPGGWGQGVGRRLIADAAEHARLLGGTRIDVIANPRAIGFYERLGFTAGGSATTRFGPALRMHLEL